MTQTQREKKVTRRPINGKYRKPRPPSKPPEVVPMASAVAQQVQRLDGSAAPNTGQRRFSQRYGDLFST